MVSFMVRTALALLRGDGNVKGTVVFKEAERGEVVVSGTVSGLTPGEHGFHIHEFGDLSNGALITSPTHTTHAHD
jgi:Cu-Zn family superoxide dismutase